MVSFINLESAIYMTYCSKCGQQLPEEANFCPQCGFRTKRGEDAGLYTPAQEVREALIKAGDEMEKAFVTAAKEIRKAFAAAKESPKEDRAEES